MNNKKVSIWLGIGIAFIPLIFAWFTLRKGYSRKAKIASFGWLFLTCLLSIIAPQQNSNMVKQDETKQDITHTESLKETQSEDDIIRQLIISDSKEYTLIRTEDISTGNRSRIKAFAYSTDAISNNQLLATAAKAAMDIQRKNRVQFASVILFNSAEKNSIPNLVVDFAVDKKGVSGNDDSGNQFDIQWKMKLVN